MQRDGMLDLVVVIPVYNEELSIAGVLRDWSAVLDSLGMKYVIAVYNDGSQDRTKEVLAETESALKGKILVVNKGNSGHGPTILQGYKEYAPKSDWIFQIDSANEMQPDGFAELWSARGEYDFLLGYRGGRTQPLSRKIVSVVSRVTVRLFYGKTVWDVNSPYRLMKSSVFAPVFSQIPANTFAPNVIIAGWVGMKGLRHAQFRIPHTNRRTGEVSIKKGKLFRAAFRSFVQTVSFSFACRG